MGSCLLTDLRFAHQPRSVLEAFIILPNVVVTALREKLQFCITETDGAHWQSLASWDSGARSVGTSCLEHSVLQSFSHWVVRVSHFLQTVQTLMSSSPPKFCDDMIASMWHKPTPKPKLSMVVWGQPTCRSYKLQWRGSVHLLFSISRNKWRYGETLPFQERNGILKRKGNCPEIMYLQMDTSKLSSCLIALIHGPQLSCKQCANVQSFLWSVSIMMS